MKRTFAVACRRACLRVLLIACPFDSPSLRLRRLSFSPRAHPAPPRGPIYPFRLLFLRRDGVSQLPAIAHSSTNWITLSCERPTPTAPPARREAWIAGHASIRFQFVDFWGNGCSDSTSRYAEGRNNVRDKEIFRKTAEPGFCVLRGLQDVTVAYLRG